MILYLRLIFASARSALRSRRDLALENLALRHQLAVFARSARRPRLRPEDRLLLSWLARHWPGWRSALVLLQPDTVVRWRRTAWRRYWTRKSRRASGRPRIPREVRELIQRIARENPALGQRPYSGRTPQARLSPERPVGPLLPSGP